jgi:hypothetical protein
MVARRTLQPEIQRIEKLLPCELRPDELHAYATEAARLDEEIFQERESQAARSKASKALLDTLSQERSTSLRKIRTRRDDRRVACHVIHDFAENSVKTIRLDTGEEVASRAMTYEERQAQLFELPQSHAANLPEVARQRADFAAFEDELMSEDEGAEVAESDA